MAAKKNGRRLNPRHQDMVRDKIRASQLINRLENHVLKGTKLTNSQVRAALGLLGKVIPDVRAVEHSGHVEQTVEHIGVSETDRRIEGLLTGGKDRDTTPALPH